MGRQICQYGIEHSRCRCTCPDSTVHCDDPAHAQAAADRSSGPEQMKAGKHAAPETVLVNDHLPQEFGDRLYHVDPALARTLRDGNWDGG